MTATAPAISRIAMIAHRGASGYAPENTLASFRKALEMGAASIEFDVQQTKDGRLVVIHDPDLKRLAGARKRVRALTWAELSTLDVGRWFGPRFKGEKVPLLEELLDFYESHAPGRMELQLEIKNGFRPYSGVERHVLECLDSRPEWNGRVVISSFDHKALHRVRDLDSKARLGYLVGMTRRASALKEAVRLGCESLHLSLRQTNRKWIDSAHASGLKVLVYTVNTAIECRRLMALGVDAVFTNFPDVLTGK